MKMRYIVLKLFVLTFASFVTAGDLVILPPGGIAGISSTRLTEFKKEWLSMQTHLHQNTRSEEATGEGE